MRLLAPERQTLPLGRARPNAARLLALLGLDEPPTCLHARGSWLTNAPHRPAAPCPSPAHRCLESAPGKEPQHPYLYPQPALAAAHH